MTWTNEIVHRCEKSFLLSAQKKKLTINGNMREGGAGDKLLLLPLYKS